MIHLRIAVRAFTERTKKSIKGSKAATKQRWRLDVLIVDTETTIDAAQGLLFGTYRSCRWDKANVRLDCREEGLIYADDLPRTNPQAFACLQDFAAKHSADTEHGFPAELRLRSRTEFIEEVFWPLAWHSQALVVGFNLPFDLSRLAIRCGSARRSSRGGFSLAVGRWRSARNKPWVSDGYRPSVAVRHLDSKKSFIRLTAPARSKFDGAPPNDGGRFLDLRTLAFALTSTSHTLASAGKAFGVNHPKAAAAEHGVVTPEYIAYNRRDVLATQELLEKLREEFDRHPVNLDPCQAYSPASIAKAYFRTMRLRSPLVQFDGISRKLMGWSMTAFFGGRAEARIRKVPVPVVHTDFTSMYPTVQCLMELWDLLSAEEIEVVDATEELRALLDQVSPELCFRPETWTKLVGFAEVEPDGDILPARAQYRGTERTVGVNHLTSEDSLWYAIPDLVASALLTGKPPKIKRAFRLVPRGRQVQLQPVRLRGGVEIDPNRTNPFKTVIEARQRVKQDTSLPAGERSRLEQALKIFANAGSYGILVEMNRKETPKESPEEVAVYGRSGGSLCRTDAPEDPGVFTFPPIGAVIPAAARLMLALLERCVTDAGGTYAFVDTDSMAIVASEKGGLIPCPGGPHRLPDGRAAIRVLSWAEVDAIVARFRALNPYDRSAVPGSILKIEDVNFADAERRQRREIHAYVISAKRYALFTLDANGQPEVIKDGYSQHGLGHLLNPRGPERQDRDWIRETWQGLVVEALGGSRFEPEWGDVPAMMKTAVTTPDILRRFSGFNHRKSYPNQIKPFNFMLSALVAPIERPPQIKNSPGFNLIAPYSKKPADWLRMLWIDLHSGRKFSIRTKGYSTPAAIRVKTHSDVLEEFRKHPESKSADSEGNPSNSETIGLLGRLHVSVLCVSHIGKETNLIEQQEEGILDFDPQAVYSGGEFESIRRSLKRVSIPELSKETGISPRMLRNLRQGTKRPSTETVRAIVEALGRMFVG